MRYLLAVVLACLTAAPLAAHPHIFVDTGLDLRFNEAGQLTEVRVTWAYDDFYSLLIVEDRGFDPDFDGVLTAEELAQLQGFDMQWAQGFNGDLVISQADRSLTLSGPMQATASYSEGRITTTHLRRVGLDQAIGTPIVVKPYDATYYTAYDISLPVRIEGQPACGKAIEMPDIAARLEELGDQLAAMDEFSEDADQPDIGIMLATKVIVTCDLS